MAFLFENNSNKIFGGFTWSGPFVSIKGGTYSIDAHTYIFPSGKDYTQGYFPVSFAPKQG